MHFVELVIGYVSIYDSYVYMFINVRFFLAYVTIFLGFCSHITSVWFTFCASTYCMF